MHDNPITSRKDHRLQPLKDLLQKKGELYPHYFLVEGQHLIQEAIASQCLVHLYYRDDVKQFDIPSFDATTMLHPSVYALLSQQKHGVGLIGLCQKHDLASPNGHRYVYFDRIQDPGNVGTMIRTAKAFGFDGVILGEQCADAYSFKVIQSSQGAIFSLPIYDHLTFAPLMKDYVRYATVLDAQAKPLASVKFAEKCIVFVGHEGKGLAPEFIQAADERIYIPLLGMESLNVAAAFAIVAYHTSLLK